MLTISMFTIVHVCGRFRLPFSTPLDSLGGISGSQKGARRTQKTKKGAREGDPRTGLEKRVCLEGAKTLKVKTLIHFQLFFGTPQGS